MNCRIDYLKCNKRLGRWSWGQRLQSFFLQSRQPELRQMVNHMLELHEPPFVIVKWSENDVVGLLAGVRCHECIKLGPFLPKDLFCRFDIYCLERGKLAIGWHVGVFKISADGIVGVNELPHSGQFLFGRDDGDLPFAHRPINDPGQVLDHVVCSHFAPSWVHVGRQFSE